MGMRRGFWVAAISTTVFLCLRYDTGYDWPDYKMVYEAAPSFLDMISEGVFAYSNMFQKEPLFLLLISVLKLISRDYQLLIAVISIIEVYCFSIFLRRFSLDQTFVFAATISWLLFTLYMSTLRQGLAVSMFFLFFIAYFERRWVAATVWGILAVMFQYSAIGYFVLFFASFYLRSTRLTKSVFLLCWLLAIGGLDLSRQFLSLFLNIGISFIDAKLAYYLYELNQEVNAFDRVYAIFYPILIYLVIFHFDEQDESELDPAIRVIRGLSLAYLFIMVFFLEFPLIRNRLQYLVLPMNYLLLIHAFSNKGRFIKAVFFSGMLAVHLVYFALFLGKQSSAPFVPFQSYLTHIVTGEPGDGEQRYESILP